MFPSTRRSPGGIALVGLFTGLAIIISSFAATAVEERADQGRVAVLLSADGEGHVGPCSHCPAGVGLGGMARRASLIADQRALDRQMLLVDAGNSIFGGDSDASGGKIIVAAFDALQYDAVNISYRDFREGKLALQAALKESKSPPLSANLLDADTNAPLFTPFIVKKIGGRAVALIGVTESPAGINVIPQLKQQLAGVRIRPPVDALTEWLPKAKAQADETVLIYYGSAAGLWPIRQKFAGDLAAICAGGMGSHAADVHADIPIVWADEHGKSLGKVVLGGGNSAVSQLVIGPDIQADAAMTALLDQYSAPPAQSPPIIATTAPTPPATTVPSHSAGTIPKTLPADVENSTAKPPPIGPPPPFATPHFCTNCGKPLPPGAKFCPSCGKKVPGDLR